MAFNDVRISGAGDKALLTIDRQNGWFKTANNKPRPQRTNGGNLTIGKLDEPKGTGNPDDIRIAAGDSQLDKLLQELDYDKIIQKQREPDDEFLLTDNNMKQAKTRQELTERDLPNQTHIDPVKDVDDLFAVDHPLDLSFTKDKNYGKRGGLTGYASDNDKKRDVTQ